MVREEDLFFKGVIRYYWGEYDSTSQKVIDARASALQEIRKYEPKARAVYFPMEEKWEICTLKKSLSDQYFDKGSALWDALSKLRKQNDPSSTNH
jgi:hypothetical protein